MSFIGSIAMLQFAVCLLCLIVVIPFAFVALVATPIMAIVEVFNYILDPRINKR